MIRTIAILLAVFLSALSAPPAAVLEDDVARQVLAEINLARTEPLKYAGFLREIRGYFQGKDYQIPGTDNLKETHEGVAAVDEAIQFLSRQKPMPLLVWSAGLAVAAAELVMEQGKSGATGHNGAQSGGMRARIDRHGMWKGRIGEAIAYGPNDARIIVMQLIIDDGISDRAHRKNLFNPDFASSGVACGPHPGFGSVCVIDFATRFRERGVKNEK